jgi:magnesium chelatase family protein
MSVNISTVTFRGIDTLNVHVQVHIISGIPNFIIVGLADKTIAESRERVRAALSSIGIALPAKKILINLSPADIEKEGSYFDLPIACAILTSIGVIPKDLISDYVILGELSLDGKILPSEGVLPASIGANSQGKGIICPKGNANEALWSGNKDILACDNLLSLINHFSGTQVLLKPETPVASSVNNIIYPDMLDIIENDAAKRALEISACGRHNLLMFGPPGSGKSMLASRMPGILPDMTPEEILECSTIASIAGQIKNKGLVESRPFRTPHHSCSVPSLVGGGIGKNIKPGEISLAHNGILFLDELPEFTSNALDALRQPIESGRIFISRVNSHIEYPADFQLIAAMNPCKCGYLSEPERACARAPRCSSNYLAKISGPIMDRFDISIEVPSIYDFKKKNNNGALSSSEIKQKVIDVRKIQEKRYQGLGIKTNSRIDGNLIKEYLIITEEALSFLNDAANKFKFSMRGYNRAFKLSRTIADIAYSEKIHKEHIAESVNYRVNNLSAMF